jgi:hypothetical protein
LAHHRFARVRLQVDARLSRRVLQDQRHRRRAIDTHVEVDAVDQRADPRKPPGR